MASDRDVMRLFRQKDTDLRQWFENKVAETNQANGTQNAYAILRQAITCLRLFGSLTTAQQARDAHRALVSRYGSVEAGLEAIFVELGKMAAVSPASRACPEGNVEEIEQ